MEHIIQLLDNNKKSNIWLRIDKYHLDIYVRITKRYINSIMYDTIELASIQVDSEYRRQGYFAQFLTDIELLAKQYNRHVYVESILSKFLFKYLIQRGYKTISSIPESVFK